MNLINQSRETCVFVVYENHILTLVEYAGFPRFRQLGTANVYGRTYSAPLTVGAHAARGVLARLL